MNDSVCALGPGGRANAVIGRAHRLALTNLGGSEVGVNLMGVMGNNSCYTFAFAENEEASPWEPYSTSLGFREGESVLSILTGGWSHVGNYMLNPSLEDFYTELKAFEMLHGVTILVSPLRAKELAEGEGCRSRKEIEDYFWRHITVRVGDLKGKRWAPRFTEDPLTGKPVTEDSVVPLFGKGQINVIVVGDPQGSNVVQGWSQYSPHSTSIDKWR